MKHILLTGATGMIGSAIVREALKRDCEVTCIIRANSARAVNIPKDSRIHVVECDISDYGSLELSGKYDVFVVSPSENGRSFSHSTFL